MRYRKQTFSDSPRADKVSAGTVAGFLGGAAMASVTTVASAAAGMGFWHPLALAGGIIYGVEAILDSTGAVITGALIHLIGSSLLGAAFGAILPERQSTRSRAPAWGILFGLASWVAVTFAYLPIANPVMKNRVDLAPGWWMLSFLVYGLVLGALPAFRASLAHQVEKIGREETKRAA